MSRILILTTLAVIWVTTLLTGNEALTCLPCDPSTCVNDLTLCKFGTNKDVCDCCSECSKGPGQICGGPWGVDGTCGRGLYCDNVLKGEFESGTCVTELIGSTGLPTP